MNLQTSSTNSSESTKTSNKHLLLHSALLSYVILLSAALCYTIFRWEIFPLRIITPFYGTMAPFQSYETVNTEIAVRGRTDGGVWQDIDLHPYIPASQGEFAYRGFNLMREAKKDARRYALFVERIIALEEQHSRTYDEVQIVLRSWPASVHGYYVLNTPETRTENILYTSP